MGLAQAAMGFPDLSKAGDAIQRVFPIVDRPSAADATRDDVGLVPGLPPPPPPPAALAGPAADARALAELAPDLSSAAAAELPDVQPSASVTAAAAAAAAQAAAVAAVADAAARPCRGASVRAAGALSFADVRFAYPTRPSAPVLRGFTAEVRAGATLALVGESGSGKSTVVALLERFYEPTSGSIRLDGVELRDLNLRWLRAQMSLVQQEPLLLSGTIRSNILYGRPGASEADVVAAAKAANAWEFIASLPRGLETPVGERGSQLSGGQKQRVAIARALLKDPVVLLLDEATAALDAASEALVQGALDAASRGRTTVVIAHRLSTIRHADAIAVVNKGAVDECGTHDELVAKKGGAYARLVAASGKGKEKAADGDAAA
jgi:ATP-binding cassette subfamily B (MDR/TAP) protein 1